MNEIKFCQSCGMPLETNEVIGTNADGSHNEEYCVYCFENGKFTQDITMDEMIAISAKHMNEMFKDGPTYSEPEAIAKMNEFFPNLKRWQK